MRRRTPIRQNVGVGPKRKTPDFDDDALARLFAAHAASQHAEPNMDYFLEYSNFIISASADEAFNAVVKLCQKAPDDAALCWIGVSFVEPLLELHWKVVGERFTREAAKSAELRKAFSCAWLHLPRRARELEGRLEALTRPGEDVGRRTS